MCRLYIKTNSKTSDWVNTLDIRFRNEEKSKDYDYQCSVLKTLGKEDRITCFYEKYNYFSYRGIYALKDSQSLGDENEFILDEKFKNLKFNFLGLDELYTEFYEYYFISDKGSRILMAYYPNREIEEKKLPTIYADWDLKHTLSNCHFIKSFSDDYSYAYCDITKEELNYFEEFSLDNREDMDLVTKILCNYDYYTDVIIYRLNKTQYPVLTITDYQFDKVETYYIK